MITDDVIEKCIIRNKQDKEFIAKEQLQPKARTYHYQEFHIE